MRSHLLPGTVSPFVLTTFDRVHGVGIVVPSVGLSNEPVWVRGELLSGFGEMPDFGGASVAEIGSWAVE